MKKSTTAEPNNFNRQRLDTLIVQRNLTESRARAQRLIRGGEVRVEGISNLKPGQLVSADATIEIKQPLCYVSRGGLKLEKALQVFDVEVSGKVAIDVGASTGGFTDCLLQHGARFVYAVDVGSGQLAQQLRDDPRVQSFEKTNIRTIDPNLFHRPIQIGVIDVAFISLQKVLPSVLQIVQPTADLIALIKPQFEAGRRHVGKGGVVRDLQIHIRVICGLIQFVHGFDACVLGLTHSPIREPGGNIEYLLSLKRRAGAAQADDWEAIATQVVRQAHGR